MNSEWRTQGDFLEPLAGGPFSTLRVGQVRLACIRETDELVLEVHRIEHRSSEQVVDDVPDCWTVRGAAPVVRTEFDESDAPLVGIDSLLGYGKPPKRSSSCKPVFTT